MILCLLQAIAIFCGSATYATLAELAFDIFDLRNDRVVSKVCVFPVVGLFGFMQFV